MTGEAGVLRALKVLVAACDQAIAALEALDPPDGPALDSARRMRAVASDEIRGNRLRKANEL